MADSPQIYERMAAVSASVTAVPKSQRNEQQNFNFRGVDDFMNMIHPVLAQHDVVLAPEVVEVFTEARPGKDKYGKDRVMNYARVTMAYTFYAPDGSSLRTATVGESLDAGDKAANKAMANAMKYMIAQTFTVPTGDVESDHEANEGVPSRGGVLYDGHTGESRLSARPANAQPAQQAPAQQPAQQAQQGHANAADLDALKAQLAGCKTTDAAKAYQKKIREMFKANKIAPNDANAALDLVAARVKELEAAA